jgi:hypothetical protein
MKRFFVSTVAVMFSLQTAAAGTIWVPCDKPLTLLGPVALHHYPAHLTVGKKKTTIRPAVHKHGGRKGVLHALHLVAKAPAHRGMCPVWLDEGLNNAQASSDTHGGFGGGGSIGGFGSDLGGEGGGGGGGAGGGGGGGGPPLTPFIPFTPVCTDFITCSTTIIVTPPPGCTGSSCNTTIPGCTENCSTVVDTPELSTWGMMLIGFSSMGFVAFRRQRKLNY